MKYYKVRPSVNDLPKIRFEKQPAPENKPHINKSLPPVRSGLPPQARAPRDLESLKVINNVVYTLASLEEVENIENKIRLCLLELVEIGN